MIPLPKYLDRPTAASFISAQGIKTTTQALADMKYRRRGPRCAIVNGKAVYTQEWLLQWIEEEIARSTPRRRRSADRQQQPAA